MAMIVRDNDVTLITKQKAYELAGKELLAANSIGDTEGHASVKNGDDTDLAFDKGDGSFKINVAQAKVANTLSFNLHVGSDADLTNKIQVNIDTMNSDFLGIKGLNVKDENGSPNSSIEEALTRAREYNEVLFNLLTSLSSDNLSILSEERKKKKHKRKNDND